jgi:hypothetical protein
MCSSKGKRAMASRRKRRFEKVFPEGRDRIEQAARQLVDAMRDAKMRLVALNEHYSALHDLGDAIRITLNVINDRPREYVPPIVTPAAPLGPATRD